MKRIVITVEGGLVQSVEASDPSSVQVFITDHDIEDGVEVEPYEISVAQLKTIN